MAAAVVLVSQSKTVWKIYARLGENNQFRSFKLSDERLGAESLRMLRFSISHNQAGDAFAPLAAGTPGLVNDWRRLMA
jgi:hypothetical protein